MHEAARRPSGAAVGVCSSIGAEGNRSCDDSCSQVGGKARHTDSFSTYASSANCMHVNAEAYCS
jgi:hypothetical protein